MTTVSTELTDAECDAFRALPLDFNGMVRAIYAAGAARSADTSGARWVSVDERFPNGREVILVAVSWIRHCEHEDGTPAEVAGYDVTEGQYVPKHGEGDGYFESFQGAHGDSYGVTHWMPLPEPPPAAPGGPAGARRPDENSPSGPSDRALNTQPEAVDHDRGVR